MNGTAGIDSVLRQLEQTEDPRPAVGRPDLAAALSGEASRLLEAHACAMECAAECGLYLGLDHTQQLAWPGDPTAGNAARQLALRLGLRGPAEVIDAGERSGEAARERAADAIARESVALAIAGAPGALAVFGAVAVPPPPVDPAMAAYPEVFVLSADSESALRERIAGLRAWLDAHASASPLDLAYSLQTSRRARKVRAAWVCGAIAELAAALKASSGNLTAHQAATAALGADKEDQEFVRSLWTAGKREKVARWWLAGHSVAWHLLPRPSAPSSEVPATAVKPPAAVAAVNGHAKFLDQLKAVLANAAQLPESEIWSRTPQQLGIDSLLALELRVRLAQNTGADYSLSQLLAPRPLGEIAGIPADPVSVSEPFPLTDIQSAYMLGREHGPWGGIDCHLYWEIERPDWNPAAVEQAWNRLIARHPMLRAVMLPGGRQQILNSVPRYRVECNEEGAEPWLKLRASMEPGRYTPDTWPLFRLAVSRTTQSARLHLSINLLIADASSILLLLDELSLLTADPAALPAPPKAAFPNHVLGRKPAPVHRQYWQERLAALPPAPELPLSGSTSGVFRRYESRLAPADWEVLQRRFQAAGVSGVTGLLTAFAQVLARWSSRSDFSLNLTVSHREPHLEGNRDVVGDFTSNLLLKVDDSSAAFDELARAMQQTLHQGLEHVSVSGVQVLREKSVAEKKPVLMPVVFTSLLGADAAIGRKGALDRAGRLVYGITQTPQVYLDAQALEERGGLYLSWDVIEEALQPGVLAAMWECYVQLVRGLAAGAGAEPKLPASQRAVREQVNRTSRAYPEETLHGRVLDQARRTPARTAVLSASGELSYRELMARATALGHRLRSEGACSNQLVAIVLPKGQDQVIAALAVQLAGAAYLPVDPALPATRIAQIVQLADARLAIANAGQPGLDAVRIVACDQGSLPEDRWDAGPATPADLAYVIFTSGSTGTPKGVVIRHRAAANTVRDINERFAVAENDRVLAVSSLSFDLSVWDIFGLLSSGGAVVIPDAAQMRDPAYLLQTVSQHQITIWNSVPSFLQMMAETSPQAEQWKPLRLAMLSGDWIPVRLPSQVPVPIVSLGGATEASIWSIYYPVDRVDPDWKSIPYGRPLANQRFHVLDAKFRDTPDWVAGELYIAGDGLAEGYWRDAERTAASFFPHPVTGERLYRTGDWGRYRPDGDIEFLGRRDGQVKISGYRVELGEIESAMARCPGVTACAIVTFTDSHGQKRLAAYFTGETESAQVRAALRGRLPDYMSPTVLRRVPALPLTSNGKIDRGTLERQAAAPETNASPIDALMADPRVLHDPAERAAFANGQKALRRDTGEPRVRVGHAGDRGNAWHSARSFRRQAVAWKSIETLLASLQGRRENGKSRFPYPSAGATYSVQTYLQVHPGGVDGLEPGVYYHQPLEAHLAKLGDGEFVAPASHSGANQRLAAQASFTLIWMADLSAIEPLYGPLSANFAWMEAGHMAQLLRQSAPEAGLGLCLTGYLQTDALRVAAGLAAHHLFVGAMLGGVEGESTSAAPEASVPRQPASDGAAIIHDIWRRILGRPTVGWDENFFEAGGTSFSLLEVQRELFDRCGCNVTVAQLFGLPTIRLQAGLIGPAAPDWRTRRRQIRAQWEDSAK